MLQARVKMKMKILSRYKKEQLKEIVIKNDDLSCMKYIDNQNLESFYFYDLRYFLLLKGVCPAFLFSFYLSLESYLSKTVGFLKVYF